MNSKIFLQFFLFTLALFAQPTNNYLSFDGVDDFVKIQNDTSMFPNNNITFEGWFNTNDSSYGQPILDYNLGIHFWINVPDPWFGTGANLLDQSIGYHIITFLPYVSSSTWYHLAVTYDGSTGEAVVYLNGEPKIVQNLGVFALSANANVNIGYRDDGNNYFFNGGICEVRLWNVVRSNEQILQTMNVQLSEPYLQNADSGLVAYWKLDMIEDLGVGGDGADDVRDYSYKQNHGDTYGVPAILTNVQENPTQPTEFKLEQNYPNPFNPGTTISWQSPVSSWQTIKMFNSLGQEVETIVDGYYEAGVHSKLYNVNSSLPSGVYFYQLKGGAFLETKKMIIMK